MTEAVTLMIDGAAYEGWTGVSVTRSLSSLAGSFTLSLTTRWSESVPTPIRPGLPCEVRLGNDVVITGFIDDWVPSYDSKAVHCQVEGRDKTADLVDSSALPGSGQLNDMTLEDIARQQIFNFDISLVVESDTGDPFLSQMISQGETVYELLDRLARERGVLLTSNPRGNLVITEASDRRFDTDLVLGQNIRSARGYYSWRDRASEWHVKGDAVHWNDEPGSNIIQDDTINRYRPKILVSDFLYTVQGASKRGQWQVQKTVAQANTTEITVSGWRGQAGKLWDVNYLVTVNDSLLGMDNTTLLIESVTYNEDEEGRYTILSLVPPEAMKRLKVDTVS